VEVTYPNIPDSMTLQEFALRRMLAEKAFDRIVIGASTMQDFQHQTHLMETLGSEENPLEVIDALQAKETKEKAEKKKKETKDETMDEKSE
jgi:predicted aldo/keto reductase-like oxidoreductase